MIARIGFPPSRVASRQLVPCGEEALAWKIFDITTDVMVSSTENYGIPRGAIEVPHISDHDRRGPTGCKCPKEAKQQCANCVKKHTSRSEWSTSAFPWEATAIKLNRQS